MARRGPGSPSPEPVPSKMCLSLSSQVLLGRGSSQTGSLVEEEKRHKGEEERSGASERAGGREEASGGERRGAEGSGGERRGAEGIRGLEGGGGRLPAHHNMNNLRDHGVPTTPL